MIAYQDIKEVHLEVSTLCNAVCPQCPRNFNGYPHNDGYPELNMTLDMAQRIFPQEFLARLHMILINGNLGDMVMNPEILDIIRYFKQQAPKLNISISTNGGARNREFWKDLAETKSVVMFCIDGLEDTHHLYRQNTSWSTVIKNARTFIDNGGVAVWKMIRFKHNEHQIETCRGLSKEMGFEWFQTVDHGRNTGPVFDKNGKLTHILGDYQGPTEFQLVFHEYRSGPPLIENYRPDTANITGHSCETITKKSIYVAANGDVFPCCFTGMYPKTFGHSDYSQAINSQIAPLMHENNALEYPLKHCIEWFSSVKKSWEIEKHVDGRLLICDSVCGH